MVLSSLSSQLKGSSSVISSSLHFPHKRSCSILLLPFSSTAPFHTRCSFRLYFAFGNRSSVFPIVPVCSHSRTYISPSSSSPKVLKTRASTPASPSDSSAHFQQHQSAASSLYLVLLSILLTTYFYSSSSNPSSPFTTTTTTSIPAQSNPTTMAPPAAVANPVAGPDVSTPYVHAGSHLQGADFTQAHLAAARRERLTRQELADILGRPDQIAPGRPGNLTPFQESKLREMWLLACKAFGVYNKETLNYVASLAPPPPPDSSASSAAAEAPKKGRGGFFSRKKEEKPAEVASKPATNEPLPDMDDLILDDDKHGSNKAFKAALASFTSDELRTSFWEMVKADHPDAVLLRFLRARKWDVKNAFVMAVAALHWRLAEFKVDTDIMKNGEILALEQSQSADPAVRKEGADFLRQLEVGKNMLLGTDMQGRPVSIVRVQLHKIGETSNACLERFTVYTIETSRLMLRSPVDTATIVFDMTNFGLSNMDYAPVKFMIKCFEANYPESLGAIFIHRAPWIFSSIWNVIRGWLDPVVASKVHFTKDLKELSQHISMDNIHQSLGGNLKYEWKYIPPTEKENAKMKDTATFKKLDEERKRNVARFEESTVEWVIKSLLLARGDHPDVDQAAVDDAMDNRHRLARELREQYWALDPYIRARSIYDRMGTFPDGHGANHLMKLPK